MMELGTWRTLDGGTVTPFWFDRLKLWHFEVRDERGAVTMDGSTRWGGRVEWMLRDRSGTAYYKLGERF